VAFVAALGLAACTQDLQTGPGDFAPQFDIENGDLTDANLQAEFTKLCKYGSAADFRVDRLYYGSHPNAGETASVDVHLEDGQCRHIAQHDGADFFEITVTEVGAPSGVVLDRIEVLNDAGTTVLTGTDQAVVNVPPRHVVSYFNRGIVPGRMTGGGGQIMIDGVRVTRGLTLHCDIVLSNNLEINWTGGNKWHLDKPITSATCVDDPAISPFPPAAPFDTFIGEGVGRLNGEDGSFVSFTFVDAGEPGNDDSAWIRIWAPGADPSVDAPVLDVSGNLDNGNLQAHYDQPHN
jgi:hypothetical protein